MGFNSGFKGLKQTKKTEYSLKMVPIVWFKTSVNKYQYTLRDLTVAQRSNLYRNRGPKSRFRIFVCRSAKGPDS